MKKLLYKSFVALAVMSSLSCNPNMVSSEAPALLPGVSEELATYRKKVISRLHYDINFRIPAEKAEPIQASQTIRFKLKEAHVPLQLDFKEKTSHIQQIVVNNKPIAIDHRLEHILIPANYLQKGLNQVAVDFIAGDMSLNRNEEYLYTLLVPDRARTVMPVFDQPNLKATFRLTLDIPADWEAIANGPLEDMIAENGRKVYHFATSDTISTYLFSFAAGRFEKVTRQVAGRTMNFLHRETDESKLRLSMDSIFRIHGDALRFMEDYTQIPYPFKKFDFIAIPDFQYGGMEHVGAIDYKASTLFLDEGATKDQHIARTNLIAHETAHMWFGDLVTMQWFNDVWMKEVFANFMADKVAQVSLAESNYGLKFLTSHYPAAYNVDRTPGANSIRQPLDNLKDAGSLYGGIIYHKAPIMMRQLERLMGEEQLRKGLQTYLRKYANQNATWPDLIAILDALTPADLQAWNQVWVNEPGRPVFEYGLNTEGGKIKQFIISQKAETGPDRLWPQLFEVAFVYADTIQELTVKMDNNQVLLEEAQGMDAPLFVLFNSSGYGYGVFPVDENMHTNLYAVQDPVARASAYIHLYENMQNGRSVTPKGLLAMYREGLFKETEELNIKLITTQLSDIYWRLLLPDERMQMAAALEADLWKAMQQQTSSNSKKQFFKAYQHIALTQAAKDKLYQVWKEEQAPAGVKLTEDDYTALALALAVRDYNGNVLNEQLTRIKNPDRQKRLQFLMPALSASAQERHTFFMSLKEQQNRAKEAWVSTALGYLHHPLRASSSGQFLRESLELLSEIQQTGDIFFPHAWLQATFGAYQSPEAAQVVQTFLQQNPDYNPKLRAKILQATDDLMRAEKLLRQQH
jgi:aminopeptidase N